MRKIVGRAARLGSWFGASGLIVRVDERLIEGSFLDEIAGEPTGGDQPAANSRRRRTVRWSIAAALCIALAVLVTLAIRAADRNVQHRRASAAAKYARITIGMSRAQVRNVL